MMNNTEGATPRRSKGWRIMKDKFHDPVPHLIFIKEIQFTLPKGNMSLEIDKIFSIKSPQEQEQLKHSKDTGDFYCCIRPFLILGRILGLVPIPGLFKVPQDHQEIKDLLEFRWNSFPVLLNIFISLILASNFSLSIFNLFHLFAEGLGGNASQLAEQARDPMFYIASFLIYFFFLFRSKSLILLFSKWRMVTKSLGFLEKDKNLFKEMAKLSFFIFGFGIVENLLFTLKKFPILPKNQTQEINALQTYYENHSYLNNILGYNIIQVGILLVVNTLAGLSRTFADLFIILCSRALYHKFKILVDQTNIQMERKVCWTQVRKEHLTLCKLLDDFESTLSPLVFLSYATNTFFICLEIHRGLTPQKSSNLLTSTYSFICFSHLLQRVLSLSLIASKVHEYAHKISQCIEKCSTQDYCKELERLERMLSSGPAIGLSGLGCFVVTRAFLLMVISVVFTVEIVLLQASATQNINNTLASPKI